MKARRVSIIACIVIICCFLGNLINSSFVYASYYSDFSEDDEKILEIKMYYDAAIKCLGSSEWQSFTLNLSKERGDITINNFKDYYGLKGNKIFDSGKGSSGSNLLYSVLLEDKTAEGYKDGKLYCSELNIFPKLLNDLGLYFTGYFDEEQNYIPGHLDNMMCDGKNPGIFEITAGYGTTSTFTPSDYLGNPGYDFSAWPSSLSYKGTDCSTNLALALEYIFNRGPEETISGSGYKTDEYDFVIKFKLSSRAESYFANYVKDYIGNDSEIRYETRQAVQYRRSYVIFNKTCASIRSGQTSKPGDATTNMVGIYDAYDGTIYYHSKDNIHRSDERYYDVTTSSKRTCQDFAEDLGADFGGNIIDDKKIEELAIINKQPQIKGCMELYRSYLNDMLQYKDIYKDQVDAGNRIVDLANTIIAVADGSIDEPEGLFYNYQISLDKDLKIISSGISAPGTDSGDRKPIFDISVFSALKDGLNFIATRSEDTNDFIPLYISGSATPDEINGVRALISDAAKEVQRVYAIYNELDILLSDYSNRQGIWHMDDDLKISCTAYDALVEDVGKLDLINPPDSSTKFDPNDYGGNKDPNQDNGNDKTGSDVCYAGSGPLGWVICPIVWAVNGIGNWLWEYIENTFMVIPTETFATGGGVRIAWGAVRDIANIIFVVLFMIVIFSQLTGVGIDNYGIKKILPKLIIVAVVVNLSWIICELAVDLSNIIGNGLEGMLTNISDSIPGASSLGVGAIIGGTAFDTAVVGIAGYLFFILEGGGLVGLAALGLLVLGLLITVVVAMATMWIILIVREAGVILMIVLAPAAIVCYALPNTEKLAKKWFDLFKALLIVYPLCGAVFGAGKLAGVVLSSIGDSAGLRIAAMIVQVLPFFFVPTLLKNSLALMGNIGARIAQAGRNIGRKASSGAQNAIRNSKRYKDWSENEKMRAAARRGEGLKNRLDKRINRRGRLEGEDADRFKELAAKRRNGTITDPEREEYDKLMKKGLTRNELRRRSNANEDIRSYADRSNKISTGAEDSVAAGRMEKDRASSDTEAGEARDWAGSSYFMDENGEQWTLSEDRSKYERYDKDGKVVGSIDAAEARRRVAEYSGDEENRPRIMSRREATLNKDRIERAKQAGQLAGYAVREDRIQAAARGARLSSAMTSEDEVQQNVEYGDDSTAGSVLRIQHDKIETRRKELTGRIKGNAQYDAIGKSTVISEEAAQQAAEEQLKTIAVQNEAAADFEKKVTEGKYVDASGVSMSRDTIIGQSVAAGATKRINQTTEAVASGAAGEVETEYGVAIQNAKNTHNLAEAKNDSKLVSKITPEYARTLEKKRFDAAEERMYGEQMSSNTKTQTIQDMVAAFVGEGGELGGYTGSSAGGTHQMDVNYLMAAIKDIVSKGGIDDLNKFLANPDVSERIKGNPDVSKAISDYMATMSVEPVMKAYGKYAAAVREKGAEPVSYVKWLTDGDGRSEGEIGVGKEKASLAGFIEENGNTVLANASKDTFKFYTGVDGLVDKFTPQQILTGALTARDNETRNAANKMLETRLNNNPGLLAETIDSISESEWAHMEDSTFEILEGKISDNPAAKAAFERAKTKMAKTSATVTANMRPKVRNALIPPDESK